MDVTRILEADHREAEGLLDSISETEGAERMSLVEQLRDALQAHMDLEETTVYPVVKEVLDEDALKEANTEHELAREALANVVRLAPDEPGFGAALDALRAGLDHHITDEESEVFPSLRARDDAMEALAVPFMQRRLDMGMPMTAPALEQAFTKDELVKEATSAGVADAARMKKAELAEALVAEMSG